MTTYFLLFLNIFRGLNVEKLNKILFLYPICLIFLSSSDTAVMRLLMLMQSNTRVMRSDALGACYVKVICL